MLLFRNILNTSLLMNIWLLMHFHIVHTSKIYYIKAVKMSRICGRETLNDVEDRILR